MEDFSLYVLDITMNSVKAGADEIGISIVEEGDTLTLTVTDNGCGMTKEQLAHLTDPFFTTRKTRGVGLGVPLLKMLSEMTGGSLTVTSTPEPNADHGTTLRATFGRHHIDFVPLGDLVGTVVTLVQGSPAVNFTYTHRTEKAEAAFSSAEVRAILGEEISLSEPEVLGWIEGDLREQYTALS